MSNTELKPVFSVLLLKKDQNVISIVQTENYDEAKRVWSDLVERWTKAILDRRPFILDDGINASAFDPGLIHEILIKSIQLTNRINPNNPYLTEAQQGGFSNTFGRYSSQQGGNGQFPLGELMDNGFKY